MFSTLGPEGVIDLLTRVAHIIADVAAVSAAQHRKVCNIESLAVARFQIAGHRDGKRTGKIFLGRILFFLARSQKCSKAHCGQDYFSVQMHSSAYIHIKCKYAHFCAKNI